MAYQRETKFSGRREAVLGRRGGEEMAGPRLRLHLGLALVVVATSTVPALAQSNSTGEVPVTLQSDHILREGEDVFLTTAYPMEIQGQPGVPKIASSGSFLRCKAAARGKNSVSLSDCQMYFQPLGESSFYRCSLSGSKLSIRWRKRLLLDQLANAGETWQGAVGSFAIGSTAALFTSSHTLIGAGTAIGFALTGVGPLAKHHPAWFLPSKKGAIPDNRVLLFNPGQPALTVGNLSCVGGCTSPKEVSEDPSSQSAKPAQAKGEQ